MTAAGQPGVLALVDDPLDVTRLLQQGLELVEDLSRKLQDLDTLLLSGRPHEISDAALVIESAIRDAAPAFQNIAATMTSIGVQTLAAAATHLRAQKQEDAASLAEALRRSLARFAQKSGGANRRAQHLNRGLNAALRTLKTFGAQETGRLIAEA